MNHGKPIDISPFRSLYPFESHYADIRGLKYHYLDEGEGNPLLMVHGNPTWSFYYRQLVSELSANYRTISPDHIGCGLSDKPSPDRYGYRLKNRVDDLEVFIDHLQITENITFILHDWGAMIGMAYGVKYPEKISRLVVMNSAAFLPPKGKNLPLRLWMIRNLKGFAVPMVLGFNLFSFCALYMASYKGLNKQVKFGLSAPYNSWENRIATLKFVQDIPLTKKDPSFKLALSVDENLSKLVNKPMLICWGIHDFVFDKTYLEEWQFRFPDADVHCFENAGHYVLEDEPHAIISLVKDFLKKHPV